MAAELHPSIPLNSGIDHVPAGRFEEAVAFVIETPWPTRPSPLVPFLRRTFDLDLETTIAVIKEAHRIRCSGGADVTSP